MGVDTFQENRLSVQQELGAARFDGAETHFIVKLVSLRLQGDVIESGMFQRPKLQLFIHKVNRRLSL